MKTINQMFSSMWKIGAVGLLIGAMGLFISGCAKNEPIRVGFVADLTGKQAELGVQERNGVQLAVDKINASGGVAGRQIELIIRDDLGVPEVAKKVDRELIDAGVVAIIGHATSAQTVAGLEVTNPARVVLLGPTISSPALTGKYEYFFRVYPTFSNSAQAFAKHIYQNRKLTKLAIIYDTDNAAFSKTYRNIFAGKYLALGGILTDDVSFSSAAKTNIDLLLPKLRAGNPAGILMIAADVDAALIAQRIRLTGWQVPLFSSAWAQTATLIYNGGKAVEGMELEQAYALSSQAPDFLDFKKRYQDRYGDFPSFGAAYGYEAAEVLAAALQKSDGQAEGLRQALLGIRDFRGLIDTFSFNQYGDVVRPFYLSVIRNGNFMIIDNLTPTKP